jgi:hypothetical protein
MKAQQVTFTRDVARLGQIHIFVAVDKILFIP